MLGLHCHSGFSLIAEREWGRGATLLLHISHRSGFSVEEHGSRHAGLNSCGAWAQQFQLLALEHRLNSGARA